MSLKFLRFPKFRKKSSVITEMVAYYPQGRCGEQAFWPILVKPTVDNIGADLDLSLIRYYF